MQNVDIFDTLCADEILYYDSSANAYFSVHDIYEEWALEKIIEYKFEQSIVGDIDFFEEVGNSLPIRRAVRRWLLD